MSGRSCPLGSVGFGCYEALAEDLGKEAYDGAHLFVYFLDSVSP